MPYKGEFANKSAHIDIIKNPDVASFLAECNYLREPSDQESKTISDLFLEPPPIDDTVLPDKIIAVDGSRYESNIEDKLPNTRVGYVKTSAILIDMRQFQELQVMDGRFVDPFRVASLQQNNASITFTLPSTNIRWMGKETVQDSFRAAVDSHLLNQRMASHDYKTSLRTTLFHLSSRRSGELGTGDPDRLKLHKCPKCGQPDIDVYDIVDQQYCPKCESDIFPSDVLRLWELIMEDQSNLAALTRFMLIVEHLLPIHYIRYLRDHSMPVLGQIAFFIDGPLAVYGNAAWMHASIMSYIYDINHELTKMGYPSIIIIGLQKTGQIIDHVNLIDKYISNNRIYAIDDEYRYKYILAQREPAAQGYGYEVYYGQDFIYKTPSGRAFICSLPYPFMNKRVANFIEEKADINNYPDLARAIALIQHFESDLYENAVIPIALAHRYTAISLAPGGKVLDILTRDSLSDRSLSQ